MPCEGCPDHVPPKDGSREGGTIVYTGGPKYAPFACVALALSPDKEGIVTKWSRPTVHRMGEIEYQQSEAEPPEIEGYERDTSNPRLLRPVWPHCVWRSLRVWRQDTGAVSISAGCLNVLAGIKPQDTLSLKQCNDCPHRSD